MDAVEVIKSKAKNSSKKIIFPEGEDARIIQAAAKSIKQGIIKEAGLLGNLDKIKDKAANLSVDLTDIKLIDPLKSDKTQEFADLFFTLRKHKGLLKEEAYEIAKQNLYFAGLSVRSGLYDGFVGGSVNSSGDTVLAAIYTLGLKEGIKTLSSFFIMQIPDCEYGNKGVFLFADCGVIVDPTALKIVDITKNTAEAYKLFFGEQPICALLSYSTKGSADGHSVVKMREALEILNTKHPEITVDGELQVDAAIIDAVAATKAPQSSVAGKANVLIFPDLASGNIAYKLVQRLAKAKAIGPVLAGLAYPANDLSRGCSVDDIIGAVAVTVLQANLS